MRLQQATYLGLRPLAVEMGLGRSKARKDLDKVAFVYPPQGSPPRWDVRALDLLRAMRGQPHRTLEPAAADWLSRHLEGEAMPAQPRKAAPRARSNPALLSAGNELAEELLEQHATDPGVAEEHGGSQLLYEGDVLTTSTTLCIDFGDGRSQYVGAKATTRVLDEETAEQTAERVIIATNQAVMTAVDDAEARLTEYYNERAQLMAQATQQR